MTNTALRVEEQAAPYLVAPQLTDQLDRFASAPEGFKRLRELVLNLAVRGRLVPQDANDESAKKLLQSGTSSEGEYTLPPNWCWASLNQIGRIVGGGTPKSGQVEYWADQGVPWLTPADLYGRSDKYIARGRRDISELGLQNSSARLLPEGSVLFSSRAPIGYVAIAANSLATNQGFKSCVPFVPECNQYLYWFLKSAAAQIDASASGTTFKEVSGGEMASIPVPLPPLAEQSRIVAKIEELMALIAALEAKVGAGETARGKLLEALLAALADSPDAAATADAWAQLAPRFDLLLQTPADVNRLQQTLLALAVKGRLVPQDPKDEPAAELLKRIRAEKERLVAEGKIKRDKPQAAIAEDEQPFQPPSGWEWVRFGDLHQVAGGVTLGRKLTGKRTVSHPYLRVANVQRGALDLRQIKEVEIAEDELERYCLRHNDLLITEGGDWDKVGRTAIWRGEIEPCLHQNHIFRARRITSDMNVEWVALFMNSAIAMAYFQESAKQTTNLASINMGELKHCAIPIPPLPEQSRIVAAVASLTALCDRLRERLAARRELSAKLAAALTESALA